MSSSTEQTAVDTIRQRHKEGFYNSHEAPGRCRRIARSTLHELAVAWRHIKRGFNTLRTMTCSKLLGMLFGVALVLVGNTGQLLVVNEWLGLFSNGGTPWITALTLTATSTTSFFVVCFVLWWLIKRPNLSFMKTKKCLGLSILAGFGNASNGVLVVSATPHTPEILQAFLFSTIVIWTFILMKFVIKDNRSYISPLVVLSFLCSLTGVVVGSVSQFSNETMTTDSKIWTGIFAIGMLSGAVYNVFVYVFLNAFSNTTGGTLSGGRILSKSGRSLASNLSIDDFDDAYGEGSSLLYGDKQAEVNPGQQHYGDNDDDDAEPGSPTIHVHVHNKTAVQLDNALTVKITMLFTTGLSQTLFMWAFTPLDAVPWFGTSKNIQDAYHKLGLGYQCIFQPSACDNGNGIYAFFFCFFYVFNYFGSAYLNKYSAAVTSMVNQLGSPIAAIVLLAVPRWNVSQPPMPISVSESVAAIFLLTLGTLLYTAWEEGTKQEAVLDADPDSPTVVSK